MKRPLTLLALIVLCFESTASTCGADPTFAEVAKRQLAEATKGDSSGVAVLVARDGKIAFQGGFGLADIAKKSPATPETKFRIGSISKQFTAAAVLRLAEQGKLTLSDPLIKYFPDFSQH